MARRLPDFFRSYLHTKERLLRAIMPRSRGGPGRGQVTSKREEPTETPLIFQEFSGLGLLKASGEKFQFEASPQLLPLNVQSKLRNEE